MIIIDHKDELSAKTILHNELAAIKKNKMRDFFDCIARRYDLANTVMSLGLHHFWRKYAIAKISFHPGGQILDLCCGTGMITRDLAKRLKSGGRVTGVDLSPEMLEIAKKRLSRKSLSARVDLVQSDASGLPFASGSFDWIIIGYGLRNAYNPEMVLNEMYRVIKPGGKIVVLETSRPYFPIFRKLYYFYLNNWIPLVGRVLCRHREAYQYLHDSIIEFPSPPQINKALSRIGFIDIKYSLLTLGIVAVYEAQKS